MTFEPTGDHSSTSSSSLHLLHGSLPREVVCTENLTPFLKLLPCKGKAGISSLLDGHKLFDASWQSMAIDVRPVCPSDGSECIVEMEQSVDMVLDIERSKRPRGYSHPLLRMKSDLTTLDNPIPRPVPHGDLICDQTKPYADHDACYPLDTVSAQSWSLTEVFGRPIRGSCLATDAKGKASESLCLKVPHEREVRISEGASQRKDEAGHSRCFILPPRESFEMILPQQDLQNTSAVVQPSLYASRSFTGHGQERGGVQSLLTNPSSTSAIEFVYFESLPWFMKPYLHTLKAQISHHPSPSAKSDIIKSIYYRPALDRRRGTQLELLISVPPASTVVLTYDFDKAILRYTEYPPDANRGFDIAPAVIRLLTVSNSAGSSSSSTTSSPAKAVYLRTTSLLLPLPTPDFSMPYNVIILTSTVMALAFGGIFNLLVRRFVGADEVEGYDLEGIKARIRAGVWVLRDRVWGGDREKKVQ